MKIAVRFRGKPGDNFPPVFASSDILRDNTPNKISWGWVMV